MAGVRFYNFDGLIQAISITFGPLSGVRSPYLANWEGAIHAIWDSVVPGTVRGAGYRDSLRGFEEILWDFFSGSPGTTLPDLYLANYAGLIRLLVDKCGASQTTYFPNDMQGVILAILSITYNPVVSGDRFLLESGSYALLEDGSKIKPEYA